MKRQKIILLSLMLSLINCTAIAQCPSTYPIDCGNGYCCPASYPICGTGADLGKCFSGGTTTTVKPSPACVSVEPSRAYRGQTIDITIIGSNTNFIDTGSTVDSTTVSFGCTGITVNSTTVSSPTEVTANITIAPDAPTGYCNVTVITGSEVITCGAFTITSPSNDDIANATVVLTLPFTDTINTSKATSAADDPELCYYSNYNTVWYVFYPSSDVRITANTYGSDYETTLLWVRFMGYQCRNNCVTFDALAGQEYWFMVGSYYPGGGNLVFNVEEVTPLTIDLKIDSVGFVKNGITTVSGSLTSSEPASAYVNIQVRQKAGRVFITGYSSTYLACDGATPWTMQVSGDIGPFLPGKVDVRAYAYVCSYVECGGNCVETPEVSTKVQLKPQKK